MEMTPTIQDNGKPESKSQSCTKHPQMKQDQYCDTCDVTLCGACASKSHRQHDVFPVSEIPGKVAKKTKTIVAQLETAEREYIGAEQRYERKKELRKKSRDQALNGIDEWSKKLERQIREQKNKLVNMVKEKEKLHLREAGKIERIVNDSDSLKKEIQTITTNHASDLRKLKNIESESNKISRVARNMGEIMSDFLFRPVPNNGVFGKMSTFIGGEMLYPTQMVHVHDERLANGNIILICLNPNDPKEEYWRYSIMNSDVFAPVVMSNETAHDGDYHLVLGAGCEVLIVKPHQSGPRYDSVDSIRSLTVDDLPPGSWITCIATHKLPSRANSKFAVLTRNSTAIRVYGLSGEAMSIIDISGFNLLGDVTYMAYLGDTFACIIRDSDNITLFTAGDTSKQCRFMKPPSDGMKPIRISHTGSFWLVLSIRQDTKQWKASTYQTTGKFRKICYAGTYEDLHGIPASISNWKHDVFVSLANQRVVKFTC